MARLQLKNVDARYELLTVRDYNLKRRLVDMTSRRREAPQTIHALRSVSLDLVEGFSEGKRFRLGKHICHE